VATKEIFFTGKAKWAHTGRPDKWGNYSLCIYPDAESLEKFRALKTSKPSILNEEKKDDDGTFFKVSCPQNKNIAGKVVAFNVAVLHPDGRPITESLIGNGSDVTIKVDHYTYRKGEGAALRLKAIRVDNLVPYTVQNSFNPEQQAQVAGVLEQPAPLF
jgi:hypothetical protein